MIGIRYEEYTQFENGLPFVLRCGIERTLYRFSGEKNWHGDPEIQLCTAGHGEVLIDGERYDFKAGDIAVIPPDAIHYTGTDTEITYSCLIVSAAYCRQVGIFCDQLRFTPHIADAALASRFSRLAAVYQAEACPMRTAKLYEALLGFLIALAEGHAAPASDTPIGTPAMEAVKAAMCRIRENYRGKITLDELARAVCTDKYVLCREFKKFTGQTIISFANRYRCMMAVEYLKSGSTSAEAAELCGFESASFFTKTFKKYMGVLPSHIGR